MKLAVPGIIYEEFIRDSQVPREEGWPSPTVKPAGWGTQYVYEVDARLHELIWSHVEASQRAAENYDADDRGRKAAKRAWGWLRCNDLINRKVGNDNGNP